jgi:hypothetical protein
MTAARSPLFVRLVVRLGSVLMLAGLIAGCTRGGQFDPTEIFSADMFDTKKKLQGDRAPVFPQGVPGTTTGVPADLVKGYQAPPEPTEEANNPPPEQPKPKAARVAPNPQVQAAKKAPKRITVGRGPDSGAAPTTNAAQQAPWPAAPQQPAAAPQAAGQAQSPWPAPQQTAQPAQSSVWSNPSAPATPSH